MFTCMETNKAVVLGSTWSLRGAKDHVELNAIVNALHSDACKGPVSYSDVALRIGCERSVVVEVSTWYQSLWMVG